MDCAEIRVEMAAEELLEPLVITEDGDAAACVTEAEAASGLEAATKMEQHSGESSVLEGHSTEDRPEPSNESASDGQNGGQTLNVTITEEPGGTEDKKAAQNEHQVDEKGSEPRPEGAVNPEEDPKKVRRLTPDFPESLYELLCTLQEGRRLNDQRCSFRLEGGIRRRCHSEPNTTKPANRVIFSSMTSLQKEEFFELVATAQARRLDDQRAQLERSPPPKSKARTFRGSLKQLSFVKKPAAVVPVPKQDLYDMILTTQAQGRLEDQRSRAPGPMDDEDFFSLLLRVQGGRMDEQRTELPCLLQT